MQKPVDKPTKRRIDERVSGETSIKKSVAERTDLFNLPSSLIGDQFFRGKKLGGAFQILMKYDVEKKLSVKYLENRHTGEICVLEVQRQHSMCA